LFAFGEGLSYSSVEYSGLRLDEATVGVDGELRGTITLTNTGDRPSMETVQLYVRDAVTSVTWADRELKGFVQRLVQPGEVCEVSFSVAAAACENERVTTIDVAPRYLDWARENFRLNDLDPGAHEFIAGDCFAELEKLARAGRRFDVILMDPPSFSTTRDSRFTTSGGTAELVQRALGLQPPGGMLVTSSNHQKVDLADYLKELRRGALTAGRELRVIGTAGQGGDFPYPVTFPEGRYLKYVVSVAG